MKADERLEKIVSLIETHGFASVNELSHQFAVSEMTIRRDLDKLAEKERIIRTYGGGAPIPSKTPSESSESQSDRIAENLTSIICESDVLITASLNPKYDPILFESGGKPKFPIVAESVSHKSSLTCVALMITKPERTGEMGWQIHDRTFCWKGECIRSRLSFAKYGGTQPRFSGGSR